MQVQYRVGSVAVSLRLYEFVDASHKIVARSVYTVSDVKYVHGRVCFG